MIHFKDITDTLMDIASRSVRAGAKANNNKYPHYGAAVAKEFYETVDALEGNLGEDGFGLETGTFALVWGEHSEVEKWIPEHMRDVFWVEEGPDRTASILNVNGVVLQFFPEHPHYGHVLAFYSDRDLSEDVNSLEGGIYHFEIDGVKYEADLGDDSPMIYEEETG